MMPTKPSAYSYIRFSSIEQGKGDSLRRQEELRDTWLAKSDAVLDTTLTLRDEGVSGFKGKHRENPDRYALAAFLDLVKRGRIARGSYLIIESLDRLSREHIQPALLLALNLLQAGVRIVQLKPVEMVFDSKSDAMQVMMMVMELSRGHSESQMKSERVGDAWRDKKRTAAKDKTPMTKRVPAWLSVSNGRFVVDEAKANSVRYFYQLAREGLGLGAICKRLNAENVQPIARGKYWARSYLAKLLKSRAVLGECQPHVGRGAARKPDGQPIADYFPPIITEDEWHAARAALVSRRQKGGRPSVRVSLFANLLHDARDGGTLHQVNKGAKSSGMLLASYRAAQGVKGAKYVSFPLDILERSVLSKLREIDPRDILPEGDGPADRVQPLTGQLVEIDARIARIKAQLIDGDDIGSLVDVLRGLDVKRANVAEQLAQAQREAATPLSAAWGECRTLLDALDDAADQEAARLRLRSAIRRMVESVWCLFVARGAHRLAAVRIQFAGGRHRDYLILHQPEHRNAKAHRPAATWVRSFADAAIKGDLDLRKKRDAAKLAAALESVDLETVE